jgi:hypothetical protein
MNAFCLPEIGVSLTEEKRETCYSRVFSLSGFNLRKTAQNAFENRWKKKGEPRRCTACRLAGSRAQRTAGAAFR